MSIEEIWKMFISHVIAAGPFLAVFASIRPEIEKSIRYVLKKGKITVEKTDTVQLSFNLNGPNIMISGSILPEQQSCILKLLELEISRDGWTKTFKWHTIYSPSLNNIFGATEELASMIRLPQDVVTPFRIGFIDKEKASELKNIFSDFTVKYRNKFTDERNKVRRSLAPTQVPIDELNTIAFSNVLAETETSVEFREIEQKYHSELFWKTGEYLLVLRGKTNRESQNFEKRYRIKLHDLESKTLQMNLLPIRDELLGLIENRKYYWVEASFVDNQEMLPLKK